ncbi:hypothetical protein GGI15_000996 [Coemansia interrupta]|uniref:Uncharacterized protein n=1 Tax=Coemansia interrupta TaxID=1126814 RepID=A0A9W8HKQ2_9FUNG|nr:hypothetical protein GGI15_000996 [Coemansia interrupta]
MDGEFTFRVPTSSGRGLQDSSRRNASEDDFDRLMHPWNDYQTLAEGSRGRRADDTATVVDSEDDDTAKGPGSNRHSGQHHYHYHYHHHYHHVPRILRQHNAYDSPSEQPSALPGQDPLLADRGLSLGPSAAGNAWLAEMLGAHGIGHEWTAQTTDEEIVRRLSQRRSTLDSAVDGDGALGRLEPHWDDMLTFRQTRVRVPRERAWSGSSTSSQHEALLAGHSSRWSWRRIVPSATSKTGRAIWLTLLPVVIVVAWCSVPLRTDIIVDAEGRRHQRLNFWFFLLFYYGIYNAVALLLVTQIFRVYSLTWWPRSISGLLANVASWMLTTCLGALVYVLGTGIERNPLAWTALTLLTLLLPVLVSFASIQRHHRRSVRRRRPPSEVQPLIATATEWQTPASYTRFLWFCSSFLLWYAALGAGEYLAHIYISTLPHSTKDGFYYVYSWIITVNLLSLVASWVVASRIRSWPLQYIYTLYFFMTYFIFYRNLFSRLQNPEQVVYIQLGSSLWVVFIYPLRMARWAYRLQAFLCRWSEDYTYEAYVKQLGRTFFLRNIAENATMLGFLCWVTVLHFGPNQVHYPHFQFKPRDDEFNYKYSLTVRASAYVWASELVASRIVRLLFRWIYSHNISKEAVHDFRRYPHVVPAMVLVTIHVLQNILFGMIKLNFSG